MFPPSFPFAVEDLFQLKVVEQVKRKEEREEREKEKRSERKGRMERRKKPGEVKGGSAGGGGSWLNAAAKGRFLPS